MSATKSEVKDLVCGMMVDKSTSFRTEFEGISFYFCSNNCRQKYTSFITNVKPEKNAICNIGERQYIHSIDHAYVTQSILNTNQLFRTIY